MRSPELPWAGGCRCGRMRFMVRSAPILTYACHCRGCQRISGSAFSLTASFLLTAFAITEGEPALGGLHGEHRNFFCSHCKSWLFTRPAGLEWVVNVRATTLDDASWYQPFAEFYTSEKLPWAATSAVQSFAAFPDPNETEPLVKAYLAQQTREIGEDPAKG